MSITALAIGYIAAATGLRPEPFWIGTGYAMAGLALSVFLVRDTGAPRDAKHDSTTTEVGTTRSHVPAGGSSPRRAGANRPLFGASQAGLVNNLDDGLSWG